MFRTFKTALFFSASLPVPAAPASALRAAQSDIEAGTVTGIRAAIHLTIHL